VFPVANSDLIDQFIRTSALEWQCNEFFVALSKNEIAVDPATLDVIYVIVNHESVHGPDELEITQAREQVWLHDGKPHCASAINVATESTC
jgi:hypothetical protein